MNCTASLIPISNHHPDPVAVENCQDLIRVVQEEDADLGIGLDGDGDRRGVDFRVISSGRYADDTFLA